MRNSAQTVIVGAGIVGASAAYHLADSGSPTSSSSTRDRCSRPAGRRRTRPAWSSRRTARGRCAGSPRTRSTCTRASSRRRRAVLVRRRRHRDRRRRPSALAGAEAAASGSPAPTGSRAPSCSRPTRPPRASRCSIRRDPRRVLRSARRRRQGGPDRRRRWRGGGGAGRRLPGGVTVTGFDIRDGRVRGVRTRPRRRRLRAGPRSAPGSGARPWAHGRRADPAGRRAAPAGVDRAPPRARRRRRRRGRPPDPAPPGHVDVLPAARRSLRASATTGTSRSLLDPDRLRPPAGASRCPRSCRSRRSTSTTPARRQRAVLPPLEGRIDVDDARSTGCSRSRRTWARSSASRPMSAGSGSARRCGSPTAAAWAGMVAEWMAQGEPSMDLAEADANRFYPFMTTPPYVHERGAQQYREVYDIIHPLQQMERPRGLRLTPFHRRHEELGAASSWARAGSGRSGSRRTRRC